MDGRWTRRIAGALLSAVTVAGLVVTGVAAPAGADPGGIVISEIHYHAGSDLDTDDFIELANTGSTPIDVSGWSFTQGITATLAPGTVIPGGGFFVLANDAARFTQIYGFAPDAVYTGKLSNGGETVTVVDASAAVVDTVSYLDSSPWPGPPDGEGPSLELRDLNADNTLPENWASSTGNGGTPRAVNSTNAPGAPTVGLVTATPARPAPNQAVAVSARTRVGAAVTLTYKVMFGTDVNVPMLDDAASPGGAGDGIYAATIPGAAAGQLIRYRIGAVLNGVSGSYPPAGDGASYTGVVVTNPAVTSSLPVLEWFMEDAVYNELRANHRLDDVFGPAVITYNGVVYDNARMRIRGNSSRTENKNNWKVELPKGYALDLGGILPYKLDEFAIQREPDVFADVGWQTVRESGARALNIVPIRTQRNGTFWSLGRLMETEDGSWRKDQKVDTWAIYKGDGGSLARTSSQTVLQANAWLDKRTRETEDYSDVWNFSQVIDAPATATQKQWIYDNVNVPELVNYMAINSVIRHQDSGWYNWWIARDTEGTGRWELWHWDLNWIFTTPQSDGKGTFLTPDTSNRFTQAILAYPDFKEMFFRRLRTLADKFLVAPGYENRWDGIAAPTLPDWALDNQMWGGYTPSSARSAFNAGLLDRRNVIANNTGAGKPVPASQSAAPNVVINEIQYNPQNGDNGEFIELKNPSTTESVDLSGWTIDAIGLTIQPGTVLLPGAHVVFVKSDTAFRATYGPPNRFVGGQYTGDLSNTGETLQLKQGTRVVDEVTYSPNAPWPTAANGGGPSLELVSPTADNSLPGNWTANALIKGTPGATNTVVTVNDNVPPTTSITAPTEGAEVFGSTTVNATASDNIGVVSVALKVDGTTVGTDTSAPYSFTWNATGVGAHTLQTVATDGAGNTGLSTVVNVTVPADDVLPGAPGQPAASNVTQTGLTLNWAAATDNRGIAGYTVVRNGTALPGTVAGTTFTDSGLTASTAYTYTIRAIDTAGNVGPDSLPITVTTAAVSSSLFSDTWPGANGSAWGSGWTTSVSGGTVNTQSGTGRLAFNDTSGAYARAQLTGLAARANSEVLFSYQWSSTAAKGYFSVNLRGSGGWANGYRPRNGYGLELSSNSANVTVIRAVNGASTDLATVANGQQVTTAKQWLRFRVSGSTIQFRRWLDGQAEPATWTSTLTDTQVTAAGQLHLSLARSSSNAGVKNVSIDDLSVKDS